MTLGSLSEVAVMAGGCCDECHGSRIVSQVSVDSRETEEGDLFVAIRGPNFDGHDHVEEAMGRGAAGVMVASDVSMPASIPHIRTDDTVAALGVLAASWRRSLGGLRVVAITGTAGKTTTKDLLAAVCARQWRTVASPRSFNNAIGVPLSILQARAGDQVLVAEVGVNEPGEMQPLAMMLSPDLAILTLIGDGHLEGFGNRSQVAAEKHLLLKAVGPDGQVIVRYQPEHKTDVPCALTTFGEESGSDVVLEARGPGWMQFGGRDWSIGLPGPSGALNAAACILAARHLGMEDDQIAEGLASAGSSPQRLSHSRVGELTVLDDSWNSNPQSVRATLEAVAEMADIEPATIVLGDMLELGAEAPRLHRDLRQDLEEICTRIQVDQIVLVGNEMAALAHDCDGMLSGVPVLHAFEADEAFIDRVVALAPQRGSLLLKGSRGLALERIRERLEA